MVCIISALFPIIVCLKTVCVGTRDTRDFPMLWPTPSSDGFLASLPSFLGAGRSGATSPIAPRKFGYLDVCRI